GLAGTAAVVNAAASRRTPHWAEILVEVVCGSGFLRLAPQKCRHVQIVLGNFLRGLADILRNLMNDVRWRDGQFTLRVQIAARFPRLGQKRLLLLHALLCRLLETRSD